MATEQQARDKGFTLPKGFDILRGGDDAITANALAATDHIIDLDSRIGMAADVATARDQAQQSATDAAAAAALATDISNIAVPDDTVDTLVRDAVTPSKTRTALDGLYADRATVETGRLSVATLDATYAPVGTAASAAAPLFAKLRQATSDATVIVLGDSTADGRSVANGAYEDAWIEQWAAQIAATFPDWTVREIRWHSGNGAYDAPTTIQAGSNGRTLSVYNAAVGGMSWDHPLTTPDPHWRFVTPDLVIICHGHNDAALAHPERILQLTETVATIHPHAGIILTTQNPRADANATAGATRAEQVRQVAQLRGFGLIDGYQAFLDSGAALSTLLEADGVHPNLTGYGLWADAAWDATYSNQAAQPHTQQPSALAAPSAPLLVNGTFTDTWDGTGAPPGWSLSSNGKAGKEINLYETGTYAVRIEQLVDTGAVRGYIEQSIPVAPYVGQWVTLAVRMLIGDTMTNGQAGTIEILDSAGAYRPRQSTQARGRYFWAFATKQIDRAATGNLTVRIYNDYSLATGLPSKPALDRVTLVRGIFPRDVI